MDRDPHRPYAILVFDWDGTAVLHRRADARALRDRLMALMDRGVTIVIVSGTNVGNIAGQLALGPEPVPRGRLYAATNRGSEVYAFAPDGRPELIAYRQASPTENGALDRIARRLQADLMARTGLEIRVVFDRLNRRKIDLIPEDAWRDPPKAQLAELLAAVNSRFAAAGLSGGLGDAIDMARHLAVAEGLSRARITSDVKHVEVGLTDKRDSMAWVLDELMPVLGLDAEAILVAGDEFGELAGFPGSDAQMIIPAAQEATFVSVGPEPNGVPAGVLHLGGGPEHFLALLDAQLGLTFPTLPEVFVPTMSPTWQLAERGFQPLAEHEVESRLALSNGASGTRGSLMESGPYSRPGTFLAGVFDPGSADFPELVIAPFWPALHVEAAGESLRLERGVILGHRRTLDMRRGLLLRSWRHRSPEGRITRLHEARAASLADRRAFFQQLWLVPENYSGPIVLKGVLDGRVRDAEGEWHLEVVRSDASPALMLRTRRSGIALAFASASALTPAVTPEVLLQGARVEERFALPLDMGAALSLDRCFAAYTSLETVSPLDNARRHVEKLAEEPLQSHVQRHEQAWRSRWDAADVRISGDDAAQRALRFAVFQLIGAADPDDVGVSIGARGLTGEGYKGHVFWDTEIFMLPFYVHTHPPSARSLLLYRYRTLDAARRRAEALGYAGALYAWESTDTGEEATPDAVIGMDGEPIPIMTGKLAHHISADVAYAVWKYWQATGDDAFMEEAGAEIVLEVARFWASRITEDAEGRGHIYHVVGPDEYHEDVDDNAYTNGMARFSLELGERVAAWLARERPQAWARLSARLGLFEGAEAQPDKAPRIWRERAQRLVTGFDVGRGVHEQFAGYFGLASVNLRDYAARTVPMDVILGRAIAGTQVIKQADVVMLQFLLWERYAPEVRRADFRYYEARCAHGSSLAPGVHAMVAARLGDLDTAMRYFAQNAAIDLSNRMGNSSEGLHMAAIGALWQAAVFGFGGLLVLDDGLALNPALPREWEALEFPFQYRGQQLGFSLTAQELEITCEAPLPIRLAAEPLRLLEPGSHRAEHRGGTWTWMHAPSP